MKIYVLLGLVLLIASCTPAQVDYDSFAQCIGASGAKMYGAYWCGACTSQKQMFDTSWKHVEYVECSLPNREGQTQVCKDAGISSYPTWEFPDGERQTGLIPLEELGRRTNCEL